MTRMKTIGMTAAECEWLQAERLKAARECPPPEMPFARLDARNLGRVGAYLEVSRRDRDGSLLAAVWVRKAPDAPRYVRHLRVPAHLGHGKRSVRLRRDLNTVRR